MHICISSSSKVKVKEKCFIFLKKTNNLIQNYPLVKAYEAEDNPPNDGTMYYRYHVMYYI
jgi:hypothetical protein